MAQSGRGYLKMRTQTIKSIGRITLIIVAAVLGLHSMYALAQSEQHPLAPPELTSPRDTLRSFMTLMDKAYQRWKTEGRTYANRAERGAITRLAHQFFDLSDTAPSVRNNVGRETAVFMKEVLDRIELPPWEEIPDEAMIASKPGGLNRWTIPHTEITLVRLKEGLHEGNWVFNSETDERAPEFYEQVKKMPYKPGALVLTLLVTAVLMVLIFRLAGYWSRTRRGAGYYLAMVFPIFAIVLPQAATDFLSDQVFITGKLFAALDFALDLVSLGALVALILGITNRLATAIMVLPWFKPRQLNAQLAQLIIRAMGVAGALIAVFEGGRYLGVPLTTLVAGVSVSGLTVALAAQDTLRNLFGSLMILLDRPFQMGDLIRIKGHQGTVESVGLRSTRIRDGSGHVVSISNEEVARLDSEHVSRQSHLRRSEVLRLPVDTPPGKIRSFVELVRGLLENHEGFDPKFPPSVRIGFSDNTVTVTIAYCYHPPNSAAFAALNEKITLQILEGMAKEGIQLSPGSLSVSGEGGSSVPSAS